MESWLEKIFSMGINCMSLAVWLGEDRKFLRPSPDVYGCLLIFPDSKIFPSTSIVLKPNSPVHTHPMVSGFTVAK